MLLSGRIGAFARSCYNSRLTIRVQLQCNSLRNCNCSATLHTSFAIANKLANMRFTPDQFTKISALFSSGWIVDWYRDRLQPAGGNERFKKGTHPPVAAYLTSVLFPIHKAIDESDAEFEARKTKYQQGIPKACHSQGASPGEVAAAEAEYEIIRCVACSVRANITNIRR